VFRQERCEKGSNDRRRKKEEGRRKKEEGKTKLLHRFNRCNWFPGSAWELISRGSASLGKEEAEPPDLRYQALPGNE